MLAPDCPPHAPCHHWGSSSGCSEFEHLSLWTLGICQLTIPWLFYLFEEFFSVHASHILSKLKGILYTKKCLILPSPDFHPFHPPRSPASVPPLIQDHLHTANQGRPHFSQSVWTPNPWLFSVCKELFDRFCPVPSCLSRKVKCDPFYYIMLRGGSLLRIFNFLRIMLLHGNTGKWWLWSFKFLFVLSVAE